MISRETFCIFQIVNNNRWFSWLSPCINNEHKMMRAIYCDISNFYYLFVCYAFFRFTTIDCTFRVVKFSLSKKNWKNKKLNKSKQILFEKNRKIYEIGDFQLKYLARHNNVKRQWKTIEWIIKTDGSDSFFWWPEVI